MSRVLKGNVTANAPTVHSLASAWEMARGGPTGTAPAIDPDLAALEADNAGLKLQLAQKETELSGLRAEVRAAFEEGKAQGRDAGRREVIEQDAERLVRLAAGIDQAHATFKHSLAGLERLAPALAEEGLGRILGQSDDRLQVMTAIIVNRLQSIEAQSVIHIEVSAADFIDEAALDALGGTLGGLGPVVHASVSLKSGECRMKLKLGTLDVGLDQQWGRLSALLQDMAEPVGIAT
jgi:flagellar biosynthesis/type III secretory pathway protein FliH